MTAGVMPGRSFRVDFSQHSRWWALRSRALKRDSEDDKEANCFNNAHLVTERRCRNGAKPIGAFTITPGPLSAATNLRLF